MRKYSKFISVILLSLIFASCEITFVEENEPEVSVDFVDVEEVYSDVVFNLPNGVYQPDNPYFDVNNPDTWTGNMAQYVSYFYNYNIESQISSRGNGVAYEVEVDFNISFNDGTNNTITKYYGDMESGEYVNESFNVGFTNRQVVECSCEVFWYD